MNASTELKQQVVDLQCTIEKIKSQQIGIGSVDTIATIKKGDQQFAQARKIFYQLQRQGHGWFKEFCYRFVYNCAKGYDRIKSALQALCYESTVRGSFAQDWVLSQPFFSDISLKHEQMVQFQKELTSAATLISSYKKRAANKVTATNTSEEKIKKSSLGSSSVSYLSVSVWVICMFYLGGDSSFMVALTLIAVVDIFWYIYGQGYIGFIKGFFMMVLMEGVDSLLTGKYLNILNRVRYKTSKWLFNFLVAVSFVRVTKYIAGLPQGFMERAKRMKEKVVLKVNKIKEALSPTELDWLKLFRNIIASLLFSILLNAPTMAALGAPFVNWTAWIVISSHLIVCTLVQTLSEEIMYRRVLLEEEHTTVDKLIILIASSYLFALGHFDSSDFSGKRAYTVLSRFGRLCVSGLFYGSLCIITGGIELAWALHFTNNFFLDVIMETSSAEFYPLYVKPKTMRSETIFGSWLLQAYNKSLMLIPVFICESFGRPRYEVISVCGYVSYGDMDNEEKSSKAVERKSKTEKLTYEPTGVLKSMW